MWLLVLLFLGAAPAWAEDLGELSANPPRLSGSFGFFGLSGLSGFSGLSGSLVGLPVRPTRQTK
jgi:hypothetical protein